MEEFKIKFSKFILIILFFPMCYLSVKQLMREFDSTISAEPEKQQLELVEFSSEKTPDHATHSSLNEKEKISNEKPIIKDLYEKLNSDVQISHNEEDTPSNEAAVSILPATESTTGKYQDPEIKEQQKTVELPTISFQENGSAVLAFNGNDILRTSGGKIRVGAPEFQQIAPSLNKIIKAAKFEKLEIAGTKNTEAIKITTLSDFFKRQYRWKAEASTKQWGPRPATDTERIEIRVFYHTRPGDAHGI